ncbi:MAG: DUF58 domain-containing protein [Ruminococcus sp.]|jgi:hypothetical protein|nr:DUF58 domain-containing protein [Ruminococcus sp.]
MKKIWFAALTLLTWYFAAMFRADMLMISAVLQMMILLSMPVCVRFLKRNMKIQFGQQQMSVNRDEYVECPFQVDNTGMLPVSRFQIRVSYGYEGEAARNYVTYSGNIDKKKRDWVWIRILTPWNGKLSVRVENIYIYDYFSLFRSSLKYCGELTVTLLPPEEGMYILDGISAALPEALQSEMLKKGTFGDEFLQLREYAQGDSYRYIHWKQSARTDILWVKEYRETEKKSVNIYLDFGGKDTKCIMEISAFYEILWLLVFCFLEKGFLAELHWKDHEEVEISRLAEDAASAAMVFEELYERDWTEKNTGFTAEGNRDPKGAGHGMSLGDGMSEDMMFRFGLDLKLFFCGKELICFTPEHFKDEWEEMEITI